MASTTGEAQSGKAFYGYLFTKMSGRPIPAPTPVLDALLRAIALHIVRHVPPSSLAHTLDVDLRCHV
jgi:hypothetical protein